MAATDILTATEQYGKAVSAFNLALQAAATQREQAMYSLGADVSSMSGSVLTPKTASEALGPEGQGLSQFKLTTGFGEGKLPTIQKEGTATTYENVSNLVSRGVGTGGLSEQARVVSTEATALGKQAAVQETQAAIAEANAAVVSAKAEQLSAGAALDTAKGLSRRVGGKKGGIMAVTNRGNYGVKVKPGGAVPVKPKAGQTFTGTGGVTSVYRPKGPQGAGWYKKGKK